MTYEPSDQEVNIALTAYHTTDPWGETQAQRMKRALIAAHELTPITLLCTDDDGVVTKRDATWRSLRKVDPPITPISSATSNGPAD